ncbi:helix-turn-helix domain-containing protein, partial [Streptomyces sp. NPDC056352]|uniref:helix-turn-helix domain-containing protein n=1 Tax=Streptomyces sp. NPDC056352 TaxID=3345791 RepID=UPI0035DAAAE5
MRPGRRSGAGPLRPVLRGSSRSGAGRTAAQGPLPAPAAGPARGPPGRSPGAIAAAHNISLRSLHRLFQDQDLTVAGWIRARRLERCRRDLADPLLHSRPVRAIAACWGFTDPTTHFSRAFRAAYGMPPGDYRHPANLPLQVAVPPERSEPDAGPEAPPRQSGRTSRRSLSSLSSSRAAGPGAHGTRTARQGACRPVSARGPLPGPGPG